MRVVCEQMLQAFIAPLPARSNATLAPTCALPITTLHSSPHITPHHPHLAPQVAHVRLEALRPRERDEGVSKHAVIGVGGHVSCATNKVVLAVISSDGVHDLGARHLRVGQV